MAKGRDARPARTGADRGGADFRELLLDTLESRWFQGLALLAAAAVCWFGLDWLSLRAILWWSPAASLLLAVLRWAGMLILVVWGLVLLAAAVGE